MIPSFEKRVRAFAIDTSGVALAFILALPFSQTVANIIAGAAFVGLYFIPYLISNGQTFGKKIQKFKIVTSDGYPVSFWRIALRDLFKLGLSILTMGLYLVITFFLMSEKDGLTIHDKLFRTKPLDLEAPVGKDNYLNKSESLRKKGL